MLKTLNYDLYASLGTADFYNTHGIEVHMCTHTHTHNTHAHAHTYTHYQLCTVMRSLMQTKAVEWPFGENNSNSNSSFSSQTTSLHNIADYFIQRKIDLVINLPLRQHRCATLSPT